MDGCLGENLVLTTALNPLDNAIDADHLPVNLVHLSESGIGLATYATPSIRGPVVLCEIDK